MSTGFGLFRKGNLLTAHEHLAKSYIDACISICCAFAGDSYQESKPGNELRKSEASGSYRVTKHRRNRHIHTKRKSLIIIRIHEAL